MGLGFVTLLLLERESLIPKFLFLFKIDGFASAADGRDGGGGLGEGECGGLGAGGSPCGGGGTTPRGGGGTGTRPSGGGRGTAGRPPLRLRLRSLL